MGTIDISTDIQTSNRPFYPLLYQINARIWLNEIAEAENLSQRATLADIPDDRLLRLKDRGFDWIYMLGVWQTGEKSRQVSLSNRDWRREYESILPDLEDSDICGSCFAIKEYRVHDRLGGNEALKGFRSKLHDLNMHLILDFVPNHTALDHSWVEKHPEYFVQASRTDFENNRKNYMKLEDLRGENDDKDKDEIFIACGRNPFDPAWPDVLQLNYGKTSLQKAMIGEFSRIAELCDGLRCDMAMLVLPEVFWKTWGIEMQPFWPSAIHEVRKKHPGFILVAEVYNYWNKDLDWKLLQQGFDYAYDKRLYERLSDRNPKGVRAHFCADIEYQQKMVRFLENHDEDRAAHRFPAGIHQAAAVLAFLTPGLRFFHDGQIEGRIKRVPVHLCRRPRESSDMLLWHFYITLLNCIRDHPAFKGGEWRLLECLPGRDNAVAWENIVSFTWRGRDGSLFVVSVNYSDAHGQCCIRLPFEELLIGKYKLNELIGETYKIILLGEELISGFYLDHSPWSYRILEIEKMTDNLKFAEL